MSVINKTPYIETVVASLSKENLTSLQSLLNGTGTNIFRSFINQTDVMSTSDKGVAHMVLEAKDKVFTGYLLYNNSYCVLVAYEGGLSQKMFTIKLDYAHDAYEIVDEELDINEFRRIVEDRSVSVEIDGNDVEANPDEEAEEILQKVGIDGKVYEVKSIISAPSSTTLDDATIAKIIKGVQVDGTFLTMQNPIFMPAYLFNGIYYGLVLGPIDVYGDQTIRMYTINATSKEISTPSTKKVAIYSLASINGKAIPNWPASTGTFVLKMVDGTLTWVAE